MYNPTGYKRKLKVFHNAYSARLRKDRTFSLLLFVKVSSQDYTVWGRETPEGIEERMKEDEKETRKNRLSLLVGEDSGQGGRDKDKIGGGRGRGGGIGGEEIVEDGSSEREGSERKGRKYAIMKQCF